MQNLCVVIPCYNEENRILFDDFTSFIIAQPQVDFVFVDDGSEDKTFELLMYNFKQFLNVTVIKNDVNLGKAATVRNGMLKAINQKNYKLFAFLDADLAIDFIDFEEIYNSTLANKKQFVFASKNPTKSKGVNQKWQRKIVGRILHLMVKLSLKVDAYDTQCGCKFIHTNLVKTCFSKPFISPWLFDLELFWRIKNQKGTQFLKENLLEIPLIQLHNRGESKVNISDLLRLPIEFLSIHRNYSRKSK